MAKPLTEDQLLELQESFSMFDNNKDGTITPGELTTLLQSMNKKCSEAKVMQMIEKMDIDGNGKIDFDEFVKHARKESKTEKDLQKAFTEFDMDGNGFITEDELHTVMHKLGQTLDLSHIQQMIQCADKDKDGKVNYQEFIRLMTKK